jgi:hypothetical protein
MPRRHASLTITIAAAVAVLSHAASAKGDKSTTNLSKQTATGKHYDNLTLTPHKPKTPVTEQKASKKSGNTGKDPNGNPNSTGAGAGKGPDSNPNSTGAGAGKGPNGNPNSTGAGAGKGPDSNPNSTGAGAGKAPKLTPDKAGVENISR